MLSGPGGRIAGQGAAIGNQQADRLFDHARSAARVRGRCKGTNPESAEAIEATREDGLEISVTGIDEFDIGDFTTDLADAARLLGLGIQSETLKKEIFKKLALKYLCDARQDVKDRVVMEIEA